MSIYVVINAEEIVRVNDKTRIDISRSFNSSDAVEITTYEIKPSSSDSYINVNDDQYLDWAYSSAGDQTVTARISNGSVTVTQTVTISVKAAADDILFSDDSDLLRYEKDIFNYLPDGHSSFNYAHREARDHILRELVRRRVTQSDGTKIAADDIADTDQVQDWSVFYALHLIFQNAISQEDDIFTQKSEMYRQRTNDAASVAVLHLDTDQDGSVDQRLDLASGTMVRR